MSEYWKSTPKKFCDFCKCWTADNRASIDFHENGKRHKENVRKKLEEIGKKGKEDYHNNLKAGDYMKEMEEAALQAYKKDLEQNPDFTGSQFIEMAKASNSNIVVGKNQKNKNSNGCEEKKSLDNSKSKWVQAKDPQGFTYYWHKDTRQSSWEEPEEGYIKMEEASPNEVQTSSNKVPVSNKSEPSSNQCYGPNYYAYGSWETAHRNVETTTDLQLPYTIPDDIETTEIKQKPAIKFEEKVVTLKGSESSNSVGFKKRKSREEHKKNVRQRAE